MTTGWFIGPL